ncbi:hypothetical protein ACFFX1_14180 [Dactylosporangium sucinum]|uniref:Uncharacterized protein n=1 Tax=Dactylosporangium sucinum TaxID=1424081 RepID=A0A917U7L6_9ACTN|nr:hypothetical protein [Dactylosporangium sucinum]GGM63419.1 hypothetical protein GCM10007977_076250 [Dactylosporangium sucinum]
MTAPLHGDTDLLRSEAFEPFVGHMDGVHDDFETAIGDCLPIADTIRDSSDQILNDGMAEQVEYARLIMLGIRDLSAGDAGQVEYLRQQIGGVEDLNTDVANFGRTTT